MTSPLPESPLERAKRLSRELVCVDELVGITERVPWPRDSGGLPEGENSRSEVECGASQSGPAKTGHRPITHANPIEITIP